MSRTFFISDTHFSHENIIKYCNRPFTSAEEMNTILLKNWNNTVKKSDTVWFLGDFGLGDREELKEILSKLNGNIYMIRGNHDHFPDKFYLDNGVKFISKYPVVLKQKFILSHAPLENCGPFINIYGHVHDKFQDSETSICVCVEATNYKPVEIATFNETETIIDKQIDYKGKTLFVASDIHSYFDEYMSALTSEGFDKDDPDHILVVCGDLFDRGSKPIALTKFLLSLPPERRILIKGNHERLLENIVKTGNIDYTDISNGTAQTIVNILNNNDKLTQDSINLEDVIYTPGLLSSTSIRKRISHSDVFKLIKQMQNYAEIEDYIFVHGWVPVNIDKNANAKIPSKWRTSTNKVWDRVCWLNGMECYFAGLTIPDKTIVCGHWHTSYGNVRLAFPNKTKAEYSELEFLDKEFFKPFIQPGIIALDACSAFTGRVNVLQIQI